MYNHSKNDDRFDFIDALRGIAILGVIAVHASQFGNFDVPSIFKKS